MTVAAIDRLVHRASLFELNFDSYRRRKRERRRPPDATDTTVAPGPLTVAVTRNRTYSPDALSGPVGLSEAVPLKNQLHSAPSARLLPSGGVRIPPDPAIPDPSALIGMHGR